MVVLLLTWMLLAEVKGKVELVDHGYEGIVIAINPYLKQEETMLRRLEVSCSPALHVHKARKS